MSEFSRNTDTEPMGRKQRARFQAAHTVISFLTERHPIRPGAIGGVLLPHEYQPELPLETPPLTQPLDVEGLLKTELNRWVDRGDIL